MMIVCLHTFTPIIYGLNCDSMVIQVLYCNVELHIIERRALELAAQGRRGGGRGQECGGAGGQEAHA